MKITLKNIVDKLNNIEKRIEKLEIFADSNKESPSPQEKIDKKTQEYKGATGGIRLLISKGFFDKRKSFGEIKAALAEANYHYSNQAVQTPLNKLSKAGGPLVGFKEGGRKVYAKRK